jgi:hypothetical protein
MRMQVIVTARTFLAALLLLAMVACRRSWTGDVSDVHRSAPSADQQRRTPSKTVTLAPKPQSDIAIDGTYMRALAVALQRHQAIADLTTRQKQIESYVLKFSQDDQNIYVLFIPKIPKGTFPLGGETPFGRSARYAVAKQTYHVVDETFFE